MFEKLTIKYNGEYHEFPVIDLDMSADLATDAHIISAVTSQLRENNDQSVNLSGYVVDPPESERLAGQHNDKTVLNIRPTAVYGLIEPKK